MGNFTGRVGGVLIKKHPIFSIKSFNTRQYQRLHKYTFSAENDLPEDEVDITVWVPAVPSKSD